MPRQSPDQRKASRNKNYILRPDAPPSLAGKSRDLWQSIVGCRPADFFAPGNLQLLEKYCLLSVLADDALTRIDDDIETVKRYKLLNDMCIALATKLRLTIQSALRGDNSKNRDRVPFESEKTGDDLLVSGAFSRKSH